MALGMAGGGLRCSRGGPVMVRARSSGYSLRHGRGRARRPYPYHHRQRHGQSGGHGAGGHLRLRADREDLCDFNTASKRASCAPRSTRGPIRSWSRRRSANLANARAQLDKDQADARLREARVRPRRRCCSSENFVSQDAADSARSTYDQAPRRSGVDRRQHPAAAGGARRGREVNLDYTDIVSPVDGTVVSRNVDVGQTVAASFQTPTLFLIAQDLTKMQVDTNVSESDIGRCSVGPARQFTVDAFPHSRFPGHGERRCARRRSACRTWSPTTSC